MRPLLTACLAACALLASLGAPAQVLRCTDPRTGKVTYTDGECTSGSQALEVEPRKTPEALRAEREQAAEAIARKQQRQQAEAAEREREAALQRAARAADAARPFDYSQSTACLQSRSGPSVLWQRTGATAPASPAAPDGFRLPGPRTFRRDRAHARAAACRPRGGGATLPPPAAPTTHAAAPACTEHHALQRVPLLRRPGRHPSTLK